MTTLDRVAARLGPGTVVVLAAPDADLSALEAPGRVVRRLAPVPGRDRLHDALVGLGHADALVDLARGPVAHRLPVLLQHVRPGGRVLLALPHRRDLRAAVLDVVERWRELRGSGRMDPPARRTDPRPAVERDEHALAASVADATSVDDLLVVTRSDVATWSVVPERRFDALLSERPHLGAVLATRPAATWEPSAPVRSSDPTEVGLGAVEAPGLSLREHHDVVVMSQSVARVGDLVLPSAYRDTTRSRPRTPPLTDWSPWSVRVPDDLDTAPTDLPGTWFHLDNVLRGHFGHALTEQLSLLWAWPEVLARHPDAGVLVTSARRPLAGWELELLDAAGVPRERVHAAPEPVRVERLLTATPAYVILRHAHPVVRDLHGAVGDALLRRSGLTGTPRRVFVTRSGDKRHCHQAAEVEALFVRHGFTLVAPEEHPLPDQVAIVRGAEVVAGWGGSGMFHLLLGGAPRPMIAISHTDYHLWNEQMIAALRSHPLTLVRGTPDPPSGPVPVAPMHADFTLDPGREGRLLADALAAL